ncbi:MAG: nicotinamide riboside transporter PnuC [Dysgonomonas sp.]
MIDFILSNWVSIVGSLAGLIYVYLEYRASIWMWAASIAMAAFYIFIFYSTHLYASMVIYTYFFVASIYGWIMWTTKYKKQEETGEDVISHTPKRFVIYILAFTIVSFLIIYTLLLTLSENQGLITIGDALTTAFNIIALWMASRKWVEQWLLLIPANMISGTLLFVQGDILSGFLFVLFFIASILGYFKWKQMVIKG